MTVALSQLTLVIEAEIEKQLCQRVEHLTDRTAAEAWIADARPTVQAHMWAWVFDSFDFDSVCSQ